MDEENIPVESTTRRILEPVMNEKNISQGVVARILHCDRRKISRQLVQDTMSLRDAVYLLDHLGYDLVPVDRENGVIPKSRRIGKGPRLRGMVKGIIYDTEACSALANDFYQGDPKSMYTDGVAQELYIAPNGNYLIARYYRNGEGKIEVVPYEVARAFITKYKDKNSPLYERVEAEHLAKSDT